MFRALLCLTLCFKITLSEFENVHKKHEYNLTFKGPLIALPNTNEIPFFEIGGHVIPGKEVVRLTTSLPDQQGWIWSKGTSNLEGFQVDLDFKITGSSRIGADGMALWVVKEKGNGGSALGSNNVWNGLGIFFDTYDNDGHNDNPAVLAIFNDGTKSYDSYSDGRDLSEGHCIKDYRNKPHKIRARIIYFNETLAVSLSSGIESSIGDLETCFKIKSNLPRGDYYFGLSAATGTIADDHDVERFEVHSLSDLKNLKEGEEQKRMDQQKQYEDEFQQKLDNITKTDDTRKSTNTVPLGDEDINKNLVAIWQEIIRQNKVLKEVSIAIKNLGKKEIPKSSAQTEGDVFSEIDSMRKEFVGIKNSVDHLSRQLENPSQTYQQQQVTTQLQNSINNLQTTMVKEFEKINTFQSDIYTTQNKIQETLKIMSKEDMCGSCLSTFLMIFISSVQVVFIIGFIIYQKNKDNSAKKFY